MRQLLFLGLLLGCLGCGRGDGLARGAVHGRVTLDGADLAAGTIAFYPVAGLKGPVAGGAIKDGNYSITADHGPMVGQNRVEIHASKRTGRKVQAPMADPGVMTNEVVEAVPKRYNVNSTLVIDIKSGDNIDSFELTSK